MSPPRCAQDGDLHAAVRSHSVLHLTVDAGPAIMELLLLRLQSLPADESIPLLDHLDAKGQSALSTACLAWAASAKAADKFAESTGRLLLAGATIDLAVRGGQSCALLEACTQPSALLRVRALLDAGAHLPRISRVWHLKRTSAPVPLPCAAAHPPAHPHRPHLPTRLRVTPAIALTPTATPVMP